MRPFVESLVIALMNRKHYVLTLIFGTLTLTLTLIFGTFYSNSVWP